VVRLSILNLNLPLGALPKCSLSSDDDRVKDDIVVLSCPVLAVSMSLEARALRTCNGI
jgi:hypothetical protein